MRRKKLDKRPKRAPAVPGFDGPSRIVFGRSHGRRIQLKEAIRELEKEVIVQVLRKVDGSQKDAAMMLGMKQTTLNEKIKRYGIRLKRVSTISLSGIFLWCLFALWGQPPIGLDERAREIQNALNFPSVENRAIPAILEGPGTNGR